MKSIILIYNISKPIGRGEIPTSLHLLNTICPTIVIPLRDPTGYPLEMLSILHFSILHLCYIMHTLCRTKFASPIIMIMMIQESLGEALQIDKELKSNQSPDALAKGDYFYLKVLTVAHCVRPSEALHV